MLVLKNFQISHDQANALRRRPLARAARLVAAAAEATRTSGQSQQGMTTARLSRSGERPQRHRSTASPTVRSAGCGAVPARASSVPPSCSGACASSTTVCFAQLLPSPFPLPFSSDVASVALHRIPFAPCATSFLDWIELHISFSIHFLVSRQSMEQGYTYTN